MNVMLDPSENSDVEMLSVDWTGPWDTKEGSTNSRESSGGGVCEGGRQ